MRGVLVCAALGLAGCGPDSVPFGITLLLERGEAQMCPSDSCNNIDMGCDAAMMVRVVDAHDDATVYYSECFPVAGGTGRDLCALADVDLGDPAIPNVMVRVQVAVWPLEAGAAPSCPEVSFANGKPRTVAPAPALGGEGYFEVGTGRFAQVELGCLNAPALDAACLGGGSISVVAGVESFENRVPVSPQVASRLAVSVGEPRLESADGDWVLNNADVEALERTLVSPVVLWEGEDLVKLATADTACLQVVEDDIQATATIHCTPVPADVDRLELLGLLVEKATLDKIQQAIGDLPDAGVVLGRIVDAQGNPTAGAQVTSSTPGSTVQYLSEDLTSVVAGATETSASGAFVSTDAPFSVTWGAELGGIRELAPATGGRVEGKVTIVLLQLAGPGSPP